MNNCLKTILFLFCLFCFTLSSFSQNWRYYRNEIYLGLGASNFLGELGGADDIGSNFIKDLELSMTRPTVALGYRFYTSANTALKTSFYYGRLNGDDALTQEIARHNRNLHFKSPVVELSTQFEFFLIRQKMSALYQLRGVKGNRTNNFSLYGFLGVAGFYFNPKAQYNVDGAWYALQPLGTEGQGLNGEAKYKRISYAIPSGIGLMYGINKYLSIGLEYGIRKTFTDYIDDVSTVYYDNNAIRAANGDAAAYLADPSLWPVSENGKLNGATNPGFQRGDPTDKDTYMFAILSLNYKFLKGKYNMPKF